MFSRTLIPLRRKGNQSLLWGGEPFGSLHEDLDQFLEDVTRSFGRSEGHALAYVPQMDVRSTEKAIVITAELPGLEEKDIDVSLEDNVLRIKGEKKQESETKEEDYYKMERAYGAFHREIALPADGLDIKKAEASFKNGVLRIRLPKAEQKTKTKKIEVKGE